MSFNGVACFVQMLHEYGNYWTIDRLQAPVLRGLISARISASGSPAAFSQAMEEVDILDASSYYRMAGQRIQNVARDRQSFGSMTIHPARIMTRLVYARMSLRTRGLSAECELQQMEQTCRLLML